MLQKDMVGRSLVCCHLAYWFCSGKVVVVLQQP